MKKKSLDNLNQEVLFFGSEGTLSWPRYYKIGLSEFIKHGFDNRNAYYIGLDFETEGLNPYNPKARIISGALSPYPEMSYPFIVNHQGETMKDIDNSILTVLFNKLNLILCGHNIKYDLNWAKMKFGINIKCPIFDTLFAEYLLDENNPEGNTLGSLVKKYLPEMGEYKSDVTVFDLGRAPRNDLLLYNAKDADAARRLVDVLTEKLDKQGLLPLMYLGNHVIKTLHHIETRGVYVDKEWANVHRTKIFNDLVSHKVKLQQLGITIDPNKPQQVRDLLYHKWGYNCYKFTDKGEPAVDAEAIAAVQEQVGNERVINNITKGDIDFNIQYQALDYLKQYKKQHHLLTSFYEPLTKWTKYDGRVHTNYSLGARRFEGSMGGTVTGRLTSSNPNLQQIPISPDVRGMFAATPGYLWLDGDYSQLELRVAAFLSQEALMIDAFKEGKDIHTAAMALIKNRDYDELESILGNDAKNIPANKEHKEYKELKVERVGVKRINFGIIYGVREERLQKLLKSDLGVVWPLQKCEDLIGSWLSTYTSLASWMDNVRLDAVRNKCVRMPLGQMRRLPEASFKTPEGRRALRQAVNFPVQSLASWICLTGMVLLDRMFEHCPYEGGIVLQVHDSIGAEITKEAFSSYPLEKQEFKKKEFLDFVQDIMERKVLDELEYMFGVRFNVPLSFPVTLAERWS